MINDAALLRNLDELCTLEPLTRDFREKLEAMGDNLSNYDSALVPVTLSTKDNSSRRLLGNLFKSMLYTTHILQAHQKPEP